MAKNDYLILSTTEQEDLIVRHYLSNERDHHSHITNLARYKTMLETLPDGPFRVRIQQLHDDTQIRIMEVESILLATMPQLPQDETALQAAIERVRAQG